MINRKELRSKLPHGYCNVVAKRANVSAQAVSNYFAGKRNSEKIENVVLEILADLFDKKKELLNKIL